MKKTYLLFTISILFISCVIQNPQPKECEIQEITVTSIYEGTANDIVFKDAGTDYYYINRGLENGLSIEELNSQLLNKKVTLHLPKHWIGTSEHIAQLSFDNKVIYTEFK